MRIERMMVFAMVVAVLAGCGAKSHYVLEAPTRPLSTFQTVEMKPFAVSADVQEELDEKQQRALGYLTDMVVIRVREKLSAHESVGTEGNVDTLIIEGTVTKFTPGSQLVRYLVGFGAGSSKIVSEVHFKNADGHTISVAEFEGGVSIGMFGGDQVAGANRLADEIAAYVLKSK